MKNIYLLLISLGVMLLFTGCGITHTVNVTYKQEYVNGVKEDNIAKMDGKVIVVKKDFKIVTDEKEYRTISTHVSNVSTTFTESISKEFLSQYFSNVEISSNQTGLFEFDLEITDIEKIIDFNRPRYRVWFVLKVTQNGSEILRKSYEEEMFPPIIIEIPVSLWLDASKAPLLYAEMVFHKEFFKILETKVRPDLLKALEENK